MHKKRFKIFLPILIVLSLIALGIFAANLLLKGNTAFAAEDGVNEAEDGFIISSSEDSVPAIFDGFVLNDTDCRLKLVNKKEATKAVVPSYFVIEGKGYVVTEIMANGFMSSPNLERVSLPNTVKKVANYAFANCPKLSRVSLANVTELGNYAFYKCPELKELIIPKSVEKIGSNLLYGNDTQVKARAEQAGANWMATWNAKNTNQTVEFGSKYVQPLELEALYGSATRSAEREIIGYSLAGGQPRTDDFYITMGNIGGVTETDAENNIFIPKQFNGKDILGIEDGAFCESKFKQLIVEYSDKPLNIGSSAFMSTIGDSITFNRNLNFKSSFDDGDSESIFTFSEIGSVVLPKSTNKIVNSMFAECINLTNIYFAEPVNGLSREEMLDIVSDLATQESIGKVALPDTVSYVGDTAFENSISIKELSFYDYYLDGTDNNIGDVVLGVDIVSGWDNDTQKVYVNNTKKTNWGSAWHGRFTNIEYAKTFYTITFDANGGTLGEKEIDKDILDGAVIGEMPEPVLQGLTFMGWFLGEEQYNGETVYNFKSDVTLTARWAYTVTFDKRGGTGGTDFVYAELNKPMPDAVKPEKKGFKFNGYFIGEEHDSKRYYDEYMNSGSLWNIEENATLYAVWVPIEIVVEFDKRDGVDGDNYVFATYGENLPEAEAPTLTGYRFGGYFTGTDGNGEMYYDASMQSVRTSDLLEKTVLYAYWNKVYTVTFNKNGGEGGTDSVEVIYGEKMPFADAPTKQYYDFIGYYYQNEYNFYYYYDMSSACTMNVKHDITLIAKFEVRQYVITYELNDNLVTPASHNNPQRITHFESVVLTDAVRENREFLGWYIGANRVTQLKNIDSNIFLEAKWAGETAFLEPNTDFYSNERYVNVQFKKYIIDTSFQITLGPSVEELSISCKGLKPVNVNLNIVIQDKQESGSDVVSKRTSDFKLILDNVNIKAPSGRHAVVMDSDKSLMLYCYNTSTITGSNNLKPANSTLNQRQGSSAIYCKYLKIYTPTTLKGGSNATYDGDTFMGGVGVSLKAYGAIYFYSDSITISGGDLLGLMGVAGYGVYSENTRYSLYNNGKYNNIIVKNGSGFEPASTDIPFIGY